VTETSIFKTHDCIKKVLPKKLCFTLCTRVRGVTVRIEHEPNKARAKHKTFISVYDESRKRELKRRLINEGRCDERLEDTDEISTF
jgi:hypothetical protein